MRIFVTGATGFIGGRLVRQLRRAGHQVVALVRDPSRAAGLDAEIRRGDVTDRASVRDSMAGCDAVFHLAAWYEVGTRDRSRAVQINVEGTRHVLETMRDLGIAKGVYTSSLAVNGDTGGRLVDESFRQGGPWLSLYDETKWRAHYEVAEPLVRAGLPLVIVQPGLVYGPGDRSIVARTLTQYLRGKLPATPRDTSYCWAHVEDVARGHLLALDKGTAGQSYMICGPPIGFVEVFVLAESVCGVPAPRYHPGPATMRFAAGLMRVVGALVPLPPTSHAESLRVMAGVSYIGDDTKARRVLGFTTRPLEQGLRETLLDLRRQAGAAE